MDLRQEITPFAHYRDGRIANASLLVRQAGQRWLVTDSRWPRTSYTCETREEADALVDDIVRSEEAAVRAMACSRMLVPAYPP